MRKTFLRPVVMSNVLLVAVSMATVVRIIPQNNRQAEPNPTGISILTVLQAHGHTDKERPRFTQKVTLKYYTSSSASLQRCWEREQTRMTDRPLTAALNRDQAFLFDGQIVVWTTLPAGIQLEVRILNRFEFQIIAFGLLPILRRLLRPEHVQSQFLYLPPASSRVDYL